MALRSPMSQLYKHASPSSISKAATICTRHTISKQPQCQIRSMATVVPPVTQDATSSKGPTAMVFMNMGGPSTTDEVGDFLSRLFVSSLADHYLRVYTRFKWILADPRGFNRQMQTSSHSAASNPTSDLSSPAAAPPKLRNNTQP